MSAFGLTVRQSELFAFIQDYIAREGVAPSYDEMRTRLGTRSKSTVSHLVAQLKVRGLVDFIPYRERSLIVVSKPALPTLPSHIHARLTRFCADHGERFDAVLADAVTLHLDLVESQMVKEAG